MRVVLLDLGGVLVPDPWETLLLSDDGVAQRLGVPRAVAEQAGRDLWPWVATDPSATAGDWWSALERRLGRRVPSWLVGHCEVAVFTPVLGAVDLLDALHVVDCQLGVVSNNTAFWFPRQQQALNLRVDPDLMWLSHEHQVEKRDGLFSLAAAAMSTRGIDVADVTVVDDRVANVARAQQVGFTALLHEPLSDLAVLRRRLLG